MTLKSERDPVGYRGGGGEATGRIETGRRTCEVVSDPDAVEPELLSQPGGADDLGWLAGPERVKAR